MRSVAGRDPRAGARRGTVLVAGVLLALVTVPPARAATRQAPAPRAARLLAEKDVNLDQALRVADVLGARGFQVVMTRTRDVTVPLRSRTARANEARADLFLSVHNNSSPSPAVNGTEVYAQVDDAGGVDLARRILARVTELSGTRSRGVFQRRGDEGDYYFVLRSAAMRAVIVEGAYLSNAADAHSLSRPAFRRRVADGIAAGVIDDFEAAAEAARQAAPPPPGPGAGLIPPPLGLSARVHRPDVHLRWQPVPGATAYRVWRNGRLVGQVQGAPASLLGPAPPGEGVTEISFVDVDARAGDHAYEVRSVSDLAGVVVAESHSARIDASVPLLVVVDPGHGGNDPGAIGRY